MYGEPSLSLNVGGDNNSNEITTTAYANYTSGNGTSELLFAYTVEPGDFTDRLDYSSPASAALTAPFGAIVAKDTLGPVYLGSLPEPGTNGSLGRNTDIIVSDEVLLVERVRQRIEEVYCKTSRKTHGQNWIQYVLMHGCVSCSLLLPRGPRFLSGRARRPSRNWSGVVFWYPSSLLVRFPYRSHFLPPCHKMKHRLLGNGP